MTQGGFLIVATTPGAPVRAGAIETTANAAGLAFVGFDRDAAATQTLSVGAPAQPSTVTLAVRKWRDRIVANLLKTAPPPPPPATDREKKDRAFASRADASGFAETFAYPILAAGKPPPLSGMFGDNRVYKVQGKPDSKRPHYGVDIPASVGTSVRAPASGVVVLAEELSLEGKTVFIDHGQGLITMYLHLSEIAVKAGDMVKTGDALGKVGMTGRTNGAHLCWRAKWRGRNLDPTCLTGTCALPAPSFARAADAAEVFDAGEVP